jgi:hypothetical protein
MIELKLTQFELVYLLAQILWSTQGMICLTLCSTKNRVPEIFFQNQQSGLQKSDFKSKNHQISISTKKCGGQQARKKDIRGSFVSCM